MHGKFCARIACNIDQFDEILNSIGARVHKQKLFSPLQNWFCFAGIFAVFHRRRFDWTTRLIGELVLFPGKR